MNLRLSCARANTAFQLLKEAVEAVLSGKTPADTFLARKFRLEKRFGSKDRKYIRDVIFAYFRWRGVVLTLYPREQEPFCPGVLAALTAEGISPDHLAGWFSLAGIPENNVESVLKGENPLDRIFLLTGIRPEPDCVLPEWCRKELAGEYAVWFQKRSSVWLRSDSRELPELLEKHGISVVPHPDVPNAFRCLTENANLYDLKEFKDGLFEVQDFSSQCIGLTAAPAPGSKWLDACAGAGGKTLQLFAMMHGNGEVVSSDVSAVRLDELKKRCQRYGRSIRYEVNDLTKPLPAKYHGKFDGVLVDAPCSSSGRWRRNPESRWLISPERVTEFAELQKKILENASSAVKPGGVLVYATCSIFAEENEKQVENFLKFHFDFELDKKGCILPYDNKSGMLRVSPWDADCDASFAARLRRKKLPEDAYPPKR